MKEAEAAFIKATGSTGRSGNANRSLIHQIRFKVSEKLGWTAERERETLGHVHVLRMLAS